MGTQILVNGIYFYESIKLDLFEIRHVIFAAQTLNSHSPYIMYTLLYSNAYTSY